MYSERLRALAMVEKASPEVQDALLNGDIGSSAALELALLIPVVEGHDLEVVVSVFLRAVREARLAQLADH